MAAGCGDGEAHRAWTATRLASLDNGQQELPELRLEPARVVALVERHLPMVELLTALADDHPLDRGAPVKEIERASVICREGAEAPLDMVGGQGIQVVVVPLLKGEVARLARLGIVLGIVSRQVEEVRAESEHPERPSPRSASSR